MAQMARKEARSVADPDAKPYAEMIRREKLNQAQREAVETRRRAEGARTAASLQSIADTGKITGDVLTASEVGSSHFASLSQSADDLSAAKAASRLTGPAGKVAAAGSTITEFRADREKGMPLDEAVIKHGGGAAFGFAGGAVGGMAGGAVGVRSRRTPATIWAWATGGAAAGQKLGEEIGESLGPAWAQAKKDAALARDAFNRRMTGLNDPTRWMGWRGRSLR